MIIDLIKQRGEGRAVKVVLNEKKRHGKATAQKYFFARLKLE